MMDKEFTERVFAPGDERGDAVWVRERVFVQEQGFSYEGEFDATDDLAHHLVLYDAGRPVAAGRVFPREDVAPGMMGIGRVAVLPAYRGGTGRRLMARLEALAKRLGARQATLEAQYRAKGFYEKLGYEEYGEVFFDEYCKEINMKKPLA